MSIESRGRVAIIEYAKAVPTTGTWTAGDIVLSDETSGGIVGWRCKSSGTPGLWGTLAVAEAGTLTLTDSLVVPYTDLSGTAGDGTIAKSSGMNAIAQGATACVITCSKATATSRVFITPLDIDTALVTFKAVPSANTITVTGGAAANAIWKFQWMVVN